MEVAGVFIPADPIEAVAAIDGHLAMPDCVRPTPSLTRFRAMHRLRVAARIDPSAAYNMGNLLREAAECGGRRRPRRRRMAHDLLNRTIERGLMGLRDRNEPFERAPSDETQLRDFISRALTTVGADVSNSGLPERAVGLFRQAIEIFPGNPNAHACLGNMGVHHSARSGIAPLDGIASWERAAAIGDYCHESSNGCPCRAAVVRVARGIECEYGRDEAEAWLMRRAGKQPGTRDSELVRVVRSASDARLVDGRSWPAQAVEMADVLGEALEPERDLPLEARVTIAASIVTTLARFGSRSGQVDMLLIHKARIFVSKEEPLHPFLGDTEWRNVVPPETAYLADAEHPIVQRIFSLVDRILTAVEDCEILPLTALVGFLFHLDNSFRLAICSMAEQSPPEPGVSLAYVPGFHIG